LPRQINGWRLGSVNRIKAEGHAQTDKNEGMKEKCGFLEEGIHGCFEGILDLRHEIEARNHDAFLPDAFLDADGNLVGKGDIRAQVAQCLENIKAVLATEGASLKDVVNRRIFVTDMDAYLKAMDGWA
jgi:hypothetical protein